MPRTGSSIRRCGTRSRSVAQSQTDEHQVWPVCFASRRRPGAEILPIPHVFHQIWLGREPLPAEYSRRQATWLEHHPGWEVRLWTEKNLPGPAELRRIEAAERLRTPLERSDVLRLEVLWRFGGVYVDVDLECLRSIEPLIANAEFFLGRAKRGRVDTALLGAVAGHPVLDRALEEIEPREFPGYDRSATGSRFLDRLLADEPGVTFIDRALINPSRPKDVEKAYAVGGAGNWDTLERLWQSLLKAEGRLTAARNEAAHWRAKYEEIVREPPARDGSREPPVKPRATVAEKAPTATASVRVPRIFHHVWVGGSPLSEEYAAYQQSWLRHHPNWELRLWTEDNLPGRLRRPEAAERLRIPAERADILRLEVVWRFGGVYVDADLECLSSIEPLIEDADFFAALSGSGIADFYFFGAVAGHPILDRGLDQIQPQESYGYRKTKTGPRFLNGLIADHRDEILLLEPPTIKRYAIHHQHRTYLDSEALRLDVLKAKLEMQAAKTEIEQGRERHTAG
jgi:mannosyltransferase OCH1-like enzyme